MITGSCTINSKNSSKALYEVYLTLNVAANLLSFILFSDEDSTQIIDERTSQTLPKHSRTIRLDSSRGSSPTSKVGEGAEAVTTGCQLRAKDLRKSRMTVMRRRMSQLQSRDVIHLHLVVLVPGK